MRGITGKKEEEGKIRAYIYRRFAVIDPVVVSAYIATLLVAESKPTVS